MANFDKAVQYVLSGEGGYNNDPEDHGKATNWGITQRILDKYRTTVDPSFPLDVKDLIRPQAIPIYKAFYWFFQPIQDDRVATKLLDIFVNLEPTPAIKLFQESANVVNPDSHLEVDGKFGPKTITAINGCIPSDFLADLVSELSAYYTSLNQPRFLKGWLARAARLPEE